MKKIARQMNFLKSKRSSHNEELELKLEYYYSQIDNNLSLTFQNQGVAAQIYADLDDISIHTKIMTGTNENGRNVPCLISIIRESIKNFT